MPSITTADAVSAPRRHPGVLYRGGHRGAWSPTLRFQLRPSVGRGTYALAVILCGIVVVSALLVVFLTLAVLVE